MYTRNALRALKVSYSDVGVGEGGVANTNFSEHPVRRSLVNSNFLFLYFLGNFATLGHKSILNDTQSAVQRGTCGTGSPE